MKELNHIERLKLLFELYPDARKSSENVFVLFEKYNIPKYIIDDKDAKE